MSNKKYAYVNNEILAWARSTTPFVSTRDIQDRIKIDSAKIDSWEKGEDYPSIAEAKKLAKLYKLPFATFYLTTPPTSNPRPYTDRRTKKDSIYEPLSYELWAEIERIINNRERLLDYVDDEELELYGMIPVVDNLASVDSIGETIRSFLGLSLPFKNKTAYGNNSYKYYRALIESRGVLVSQISGVSINEMKGISLYYDCFPVIAVNNKDYDRAKAFSLFHELAHLVRRSSSLCLIDFDKRNDSEEKLCDAIAAEVLMPRMIFLSVVEDAVKQYHKYSDECLNYIADRFGVSIFSVIRRLYETDIIKKKEYISMYEEFSRQFEEKQAEIDFINESKYLRIPYYIRFLNREGYLYTRTIMTAYSKGYISYGELCNTLGVKSVHINKMERAVMSL